MEYRTSLDKTAVVITVAVTIVFVVVVVGQYPYIRDEGRTSSIVTAAVCVVAYGLGYLLRPLGYIVTPDELVIRRPIGTVHVKRADIRSVELLEAEQVRGTIRTFGVGGLFGYYGSFANRTIGRMTWYATRRDRMVLVRTAEGKKIVLSPDEREAFVAELGA